MTNDILFITQAIPQVEELLRRLAARQATFDDPTKSAIRAVWRAVDQTRTHLAAIQSGRANEQDANPELVGLWSDAALAINDVDPAFAERLRMKAEYWSEPRNWHPQPGFDISITTVANEARGLLRYATRNASTTEVLPSKDSDVFISHAREDKEAVARPLADGLHKHGYIVWFDQYTLRLGDSLRRKIDEGLATCRYGVVILSPDFFRKDWPQRELDGLVALESVDRRKRILPVWHNVTAEVVARHSPTIADRLGVSTELGMDVVVNQVIDVIEGEVGRPPTRS